MDAILQSLRSTTSAAQHHEPQEQSKGGVLDEELRVYGTNGFVIIDSILFSSAITTRKQVAVYAAAEKAAEIFRHGLKLECNKNPASRSHPVSRGKFIRAADQRQTRTRVLLAVADEA